MAIETTLGPFLDALKAQLDARAGLTGVNVLTGWVGEDGGLESIQFQRAKSTEQWAGLGNRAIEEEYELDGFVWIARAGAGETVIKAARDRATAIYNELLQQLRTDPTVSSTVRVARVSAFEMEQGLTGDGMRVCKIDVTLLVQARLSAS